MTGKKVVGSKNDISKSCPKFCKLVDGFFFSLTTSQKCGFYSQKTLLLKGAKNHRVKEVIKAKNDLSKSCSKFCKLGDEFFLFRRNLKN